MGAAPHPSLPDLQLLTRKRVIPQEPSPDSGWLQEVEAVAAFEITDVLTWGADGSVQVTPSSQLSARARKAIKKFKYKQTADGFEIEVEAHDKLSANRQLARAEERGGLNRPGFFGLTIVGPKDAADEVDQ